MKATYLEELDSLPPIICWLLAREPRQGRGVPMTRLLLSHRLGWSASRVRHICGLWSWATITVGDADNFRKACGIPRHAERRQRAYLKRTFRRLRSFSHIRSRKKAKIVDWIRSEVA